mmetsp:Transcript_38568/g.100192  ORF Transcript_38568/g.100192 Transcript_38568/m.100192 type:complete len:208 (+) Transcript_38568:145-768(+)
MRRRHPLAARARASGKAVSLFVQVEVVLLVQDGLRERPPLGAFAGLAHGFRLPSLHPGLDPGRQPLQQLAVPRLPCRDALHELQLGAAPKEVHVRSEDVEGIGEYVFLVVHEVVVDVDQVLVHAQKLQQGLVVFATRQAVQQQVEHPVVEALGKTAGVHLLQCEGAPLFLNAPPHHPPARLQPAARPHGLAQPALLPPVLQARVKLR